VAKRAGVGITGRLRAGAALTPHGEFNIVIAGLAVAAGVNSQLGPLAAAYVLILAVVGPILARGVEPFAAACAAVRLHARAGVRAADERGVDGVIARDVIEALPRAW